MDDSVLEIEKKKKHPKKQNLNDKMLSGIDRRRRRTSCRDASSRLPRTAVTNIVAEVYTCGRGGLSFPPQKRKSVFAVAVAVTTSVSVLSLVSGWYSGSHVLTCTSFCQTQVSSDWWSAGGSRVSLKRSLAENDGNYAALTRRVYS